MKYIIDLIEDIREQIGNQETYLVAAGLLKEDANDSTKLVYTGEAPISSVVLNNEKKQLEFYIDRSNQNVTIEALVSPLLILDMNAMMYELKIHVNEEYKNMEIVGFGKNDEEKRYILFIKI